MLEITSINALTTFNNFAVINWTVADTLEDMDNYTFSIYASISPDGNYAQIANNIQGYEYIYPLPSSFDSSVHLYFKVEVVHSSGLSKYGDVVGAFYLTPRDSIADTIIYQTNYFLEHVLNRPPVRLLIKRRTGQRCEVCWDEETQEVTKSHCLSCYSVGYKGGYLPTRPIYISFTEPGFISKFDMSDVRDVQQNVTSAWSTNYPLILPDDVIIDEFNRRFRVLQVQPTTKDGRIYIRQIMQLQLIPPTDVIYKYPLEETAPPYKNIFTVRNVDTLSSEDIMTTMPYIEYLFVGRHMIIPPKYLEES